MKSEDELHGATVPAEVGADFRAEKASGLAQITPLNSRATAWLGSAVSRESSWVGEMLVVETRYFADIADAAIDAGFLFERQAYLN